MGYIVWPPGGGGGGSIYVNGSSASPSDITAVGGISSSNGDFDYYKGLQAIFVQGDSGSVDITASPQVGPHSKVGAILILIGKSDTNSIIFDNGDGLSLNGPMIMGEDDVLAIFYDGTNWIELYRSN